MGKGGKRPGAGTHYSPSERIRLAHHYATYKWAFNTLKNFGHKFGHKKLKPAYEALRALHADEHPNGGGSIETTKRLVVQGRHDDIFLSELAVKRHNREPLTEAERSFLGKWTRLWRRRHRH